MLAIFLFVFAVSVLILLHEWGHFFMAKRSGMKVEEFGLGFPPRVFGKQYGETLYSINLIPLGGFVKIFGEDNSLKDKAGSFSSKSFLSKLLVIFAGVGINFLIVWIILSIVLMSGVFYRVSGVDSAPPVNLYDEGVYIEDVFESSAASSAGLAKGDRVLSVLTEYSSFYPESAEDFLSIIGSLESQSVVIEYERDGVVLETGTIIEKTHSEKQGLLGAEVVYGGVASFSPGESLWVAGKSSFRGIGAISSSLYESARNLIVRGEEPKGIVGPVGVVKLAGEAQGVGAIYYLQFLALLSLNLAVLNSVPFPPLDGGKALFLVIEKIKGSPINKKVESVINSVGLALLLSLIVVITIRDIINF